MEAHKKSVTCSCQKNSSKLAFDGKDEADDLSPLDRMRKARREKANAMEARRRHEYDLMGIEELEKITSQGVYLPFRKLEDCYSYDVRMLELEAQADVFDIGPGIFVYGKALKRVEKLNQDRGAVAMKYATIVAEQIEHIDKSGISEDDVFPSYKPFLYSELQERHALVDFKEGLEITAKDYMMGKIGYDKGLYPMQDQPYRLAVHTFVRKFLPFLIRS